MEGLDLLQRAQAAGLDMSVDGATLVIRGPRSADALARELLTHKGHLLTLLARQDASPDGLPAFHRDLLTTVRETMGAYAALDLLPSLVLGARLARGTITAIRCGITTKCCTTCCGIPCEASEPWTVQRCSSESADW